VNEVSLLEHLIKKLVKMGIFALHI